MRLKDKDFEKYVKRERIRALVPRLEAPGEKVFKIGKNFVYVCRNDGQIHTGNFGKAGEKGRHGRATFLEKYDYSDFLYLHESGQNWMD